MNGPFQVHEPISYNAYKIDLLGEYKVLATFNVSDFSLFDVGEDSRSNLFKRGTYDKTHDVLETVDLFQGKITRARVKKIKEFYEGKSNELLAHADKAMKEGLKLMSEGLIHVSKESKVFVLHPINKEQ